MHRVLMAMDCRATVEEMEDEDAPHIVSPACDRTPATEEVAPVVVSTPTFSTRVPATTFSATALTFVVTRL